MRGIRKRAFGLAALGIVAVGGAAVDGVAWGQELLPDFDRAALACDAIDAGDVGLACDSMGACDGAYHEAYGASGGGGWLSQDKMLGDWLGLRGKLAEHGITYDIYATQFYQGMAAGGRENGWPYGGKFDTLVNLDGEKFGMQRGFFVNMHVESRLGKSINEIDGALLPSNIAMQFPEGDENITAITGLKFTQALSPNFAVFAGKINTLDEYALRYAGGPGLGGFMNSSLVFNPILARTVPYGAAGVGFAVLSDLEPVFAFSVLDPQERAADGLNDLYQRGTVLLTDVIFRPEFGGRRGIYNFGGSYSNADYTSIDPSLWLNLPPGPIVAPTEAGSWCLYSNIYQALFTSSRDASKSWGVFGQYGISDGNPNPIDFTASIGVGGASLVSGRENDRFGAGFFYVGLSNNFKQLMSVTPYDQDDEYGFETFYNYALTPWARLTGDVQFVDPSTRQYGSSIIPGLRLQAIF